MLLKDGPNTYDDWLAEISRAERWVHPENYIFEADEVGYRFADALCERAAKDVRVRVLYDWFGCLDVPGSFWRRLRDAGVEVRVANPPTLGAPLGVVRRDHRKLLAAAASGALLGSSLLAARFPRLVAWPLATTGALLGGMGVLRAVRSALASGVPTPPDPKYLEQGEQ